MRRIQRGGLSLIELIVASAIMAMMAAALGTLALAVSTASGYTRGNGVAVQHGRVALERIRAACLESHASEAFPGFISVEERIGAWRFPDVLVVWRSSNPANPEGLPRFNEVVIFAPDPQAPRRLLEIKAPGDTRTVPAPANQAAWRTEVASLYTRSGVERTALTNLVRTPTVTGGTRRAAVRFDVRLRPSADDLQSFRDGDLDWNDLPWAQSIHGARMGLRQTWCRMELQLMPGEEAFATDPDGESALTLIGSAATYHTLSP